MHDEPKLIYVTKAGNEYSTREKAEEEVLEEMTQEDFFSAFMSLLGRYDLLEWALKQEAFYQTFEEKIAEANQIVFDENITACKAEDF